MPNNRTRGNNYERQIVNELKDLGFLDVVTSRAESRNMDNKGVDVFGHSLPVYIQAKNYTKYPDSHSLLTSELLPTEKPTVIFHKKTKKANSKFMTQGEYVYMNKDLFYEVLKFKNKLAKLAETLAYSRIIEKYIDNDNSLEEEDLYEIDKNNNRNLKDVYSKAYFKYVQYYMDQISNFDLNLFKNEIR